MRGDPSPWLDVTITADGDAVLVEQLPAYDYADVHTLESMVRRHQATMLVLHDAGHDDVVLTLSDPDGFLPTATIRVR